MMNGIQIIESLLHTETVHDFSRCRSPGRAKRRLVRGIRGRVVTRQVPRKDVLSLDDGRTLVMHPNTAAALRAELEAFAVKWHAASESFYHGPFSKGGLNDLLR